MYASSGRTYTAIPGPSVIPDRVLNAMHRASPDIYSTELRDLTSGLIDDLKGLVRTKGEAAIYIANGHGAWEASVSNLFSRGDTVLVLETGLFANGWGGFASALGVNVETIDFGMRSDVDCERLAETLKQDSDGRIKAVLTVHVDTASSVRNDITAISKAIQAAGHPALLLVDCIASLACDDFQMDEWGADVVLAASQKGLMLAPGLAFVFFNQRALQAGRSADLRTPYWDWQRRVDPDEFYQRFCGTAPTSLLFGLHESLQMLIHEEGLASVFERHERLARAIWSAVGMWGQGGPLEFNIPDPSKRSHAVTAIRAGPPYGSKLRDWVSRNAGLNLGIGLGMSTPEDSEATGSFRIGHMGHINPHMILGALASIEAGFEAIGYRRGRGALEAAAAECGLKDSGQPLA
ncbi:MAG: aminotransferase class V-fold PLP-dependent enzyme [Rhodobacteraceae bacterium]|nr:aminotransferase class V-fold PLP-dependent enzyme [Paracoccaceae bacterium]